MTERKRLDYEIFPQSEMMTTSSAPTSGSSSPVPEDEEEEEDEWLVTVQGKY